LWYVVMKTDPEEFSRRKVTVRGQIIKILPNRCNGMSVSQNNDNTSGNW
jgi:hypothetical protein